MSDKLHAIVLQRGAREHYAVARALHHESMLAGLFTDWYAPRSQVGRAMLSLLGHKHSASALAAFSGEIPGRLVRSFPCRSFYWRWKLRRMIQAGL